jgi:hypothetical protein
LASLAQDVLSHAGPLGTGLAVSLLLPVHRSAPGLPPICDSVEVFANTMAVECERLQTRVRQGPRLLAATGRRGVLVSDLSREQRWPVFRTTAVTRHGLAAVQVEPLNCRGAPVVGTLAWYTDRAAPFNGPGAAERRRDYAATVTAAVLALHRTAGRAR